MALDHEVISDFQVAADKLQGKADAIQNLGKGFLAGIANNAARQVAPEVRMNLIKNYNSSGLGSRSKGSYVSSGKMRDALARVTVKASFSKTGMKLVFQMPAGVAPYKNRGGTMSDFYAVAGALNFGTNRAIANRAKRDASGRKVRSDAKPRKKIISIPSYNFFKMTSGQARVIMQKFETYMMKELSLAVGA